MSNLQPNGCLEFDFQKVDQHAGGKWLIHDTKRRKDNQLQSLKLPMLVKGDPGILFSQARHGLSHDDDIMTWTHFLHYWPFVWGIHQSPVMNSFWWFLFHQLEQAVEQTIDLSMIWDTMTLLWRHYNNIRVFCRKLTPLSPWWRCHMSSSRHNERVLICDKI